MKKIKFGTCLPPFFGCCDRYCKSGYTTGEKTLEQVLDEAVAVKDLCGIELMAGLQITKDNAAELNAKIKARNLEICLVVTDLWTKAEYGKGSVTSVDAKIRKQAIKDIKDSMDMAAAVGCNAIDVWLGQDGYEYSFQSDYTRDWDYIVRALKECAVYNQNVKICIEYKQKEPRNFCFVANASKTLLLVNEIDEINVGVLLDVGHSIAAAENPAEAVALIKRYGEKLFYIHLNDNYRTWDDDMIIGAVNTPAMLEFLFWLEKTGYNGWFTADIYPYREGVAALTETFEWVKAMRSALKNTGLEKIHVALKKSEGAESMKLLRDIMFK